MTFSVEEGRIGRKGEGQKFQPSRPRFHEVWKIPGDHGALVLPSADEKTASENLSTRWQAGGRTRTGISASHLVTDHGLPLTMLVEETWMGQ